MKVTGAGHAGLRHAPLINRSGSAPAAVPSARSHPLAALTTVVLAAVLHNSGAQPITVESVTLADSAGVIVTPGVDPWVLEEQSKAMEKEYRASGKAFVRSARPSVLIVLNRMTWNCVSQTRGVTT
jgi:hypothetical protein